MKKVKQLNTKGDQSELSHTFKSVVCRWMGMSVWYAAALAVALLMRADASFPVLKCETFSEWV
jgi:hypothetical protein